MLRNITWASKRSSPKINLLTKRYCNTNQYVLESAFVTGTSPFIVLYCLLITWCWLHTFGALPNLYRISCCTLLKFREDTPGSLLSVEGSITIVLVSKGSSPIYMVLRTVLYPFRTELLLSHISVFEPRNSKTVTSPDSHVWPTQKDMRPCRTSVVC